VNVDRYFLKPSIKNSMRHGSLFSGIGGFDLAAEWMGWENVFHCEWAQLSPLFVMEMMGFPTSWTALPFLGGEPNLLCQEVMQ
jgi:hypothetical protein